MAASVPLFWLVLAFAGLVLGWLWFWGGFNYRKGRRSEKQRRFKDACYEYAVAIQVSEPASKECRRRLLSLWARYGPFDYADELRRIRKDDTPEKCGEAGYYGTLEVLHKIVKKNN